MLDNLMMKGMQYYLLVVLGRLQRELGYSRGKKTGTLYMTSSPRKTIAVAEASTDTSLWQCKLGHMSEKGMKMLLSKGKLPELKFVDFDMCESCILRK